MPAMPAHERGTVAAAASVEAPRCTRLEGTVLDGHGRTVGGGVELAPDGTIARVLPNADAAPGDPGTRCWITPGLVDVHCHGGGGASFPDMTDQAEVTTAVAAHRPLGTTVLVASLVSLRDPLPGIRLLAEACRRGDLVGIHLEGPYLSRAKAGAQNPAAIREPDLAELHTWLEAGDGHIRTMTIAPEVPGAGEVARLLLEHGARPSWGHTSADGPTTRRILGQTAAAARALGIEGPAQTATHLFNAMPPIGHRAPGPVLELLRAARRDECVVELVADGVHLAPELVGEVVAWLGPRGAAQSPDAARIAFVSDAMAGAGMPDGAYTLGGLPVTIAGGVARLTDTGAIAGGTARIAEQVARMVRAGAVTMADAIRAAVAGPIQALGLDSSLPGISPAPAVGEPANLVVWDADLTVTGVFHEGRAVPTH